MLKEVIEHESLKGFYKCHNLENVYISKNGDIYDDLAKQQIVTTKPSNGYSYIKGMNISVHRLMCETFLVEPPNIEKHKLIPNHKNGIKLDNKLSNLEWTDYSGNIKHAYENGLRTDNIPILIKDLRTGEIVRFCSIEEAARNHNVNGSNIYWYLRSKTVDKVFKKYYVLIRESDQWPTTDQRAMSPIKAGVARDILILDKKTNQYFLFKNAKDAGDFVGLKENSLTMRIRRAISKGLNGYSDNEIDAFFLDMVKNKPTNINEYISKRPIPVYKRTPRPPLKIIVTDLITGGEKEYYSSEVFAKSIGVSKATFQKHIFVNKGIWRKSHHVRYLR